MTTQTEATQYIKATLTAFGPGEAISMTKETWTKLHEAMTTLVAQPAREWVGLTDEEIIIMSRYDLEYATLIGEVQKKLKEKNTK